MRKLLNLVLLAALVLAGCKKSEPDNDDNKNTCPPELVGRWVRGKFSMAGLETYQGTTIMDASLTTGALEFLADGRVKAYSVGFPTNPQAGCNPQVLSVFTGMGDYGVAGKVVMRFDGGLERKYYQQCPGSSNTSKVLTANDFTGALQCYWSVDNSSGKTLLAIRYDLPDNPKIYFEKKDW